MAWRRQLPQPLTTSSYGSEQESVFADIAAVARAAHEDPEDLIREVRAFRAALPRSLALSDAMDSVAASTLVPRVADVSGPSGHDAIDLGLVGRETPPARLRDPRRGVMAAAGLLVIALLSGTAVAVVAQRGGHQDRTRVQAMEVSAAQQYGILALAVQDQSPGQIVAASDALHASLLPLIREAQSDRHAATTALLLLTNERTLLMGAPLPNESIASALQQTQVLLTQLKNTTDTPLPTLSPVILPPSPSPSAAPSPSVEPVPTPVPPTPTPTPPAPTSTPEPPNVTPTPSPSDILVLGPNASPTPSASAPASPPT